MEQGKTSISLGWCLLVGAYGLFLLSLCLAWGLHLLSLEHEHLINSDDNLQTLSARFPNETWLDFGGSISGVSRVLKMETEPEVVVYFDLNGNVMATRLGIASLPWYSDPIEVIRLLILFAIGLILLDKRKQTPSVSLRSIGFILMGFVSGELSEFLWGYYPLNIWGIVGGLCFLWAAIVLSCIAFVHWYRSKMCTIHL